MKWLLILSNTVLKLNIGTYVANPVMDNVRNFTRAGLFISWFYQKVCEKKSETEQRLACSVYFPCVCKSYRKDDINGDAKKIQLTNMQASRHSKSVFFCAVKTLVLKFCARKSKKNLTKNHIIYVKHEEKNIKEVRMHNF